MPQEKISNITFKKWPQNLYIRTELSLPSFLDIYFPRDQSRKFKIARWWPFRETESLSLPENVEAFRFHNGNLLVWGDAFFYKSPYQEKARSRFQHEVQAIEALLKLKVKWVPGRDLGFDYKKESLRFPLLKPLNHPDVDRSLVDETVVGIYHDMHALKLSHGDFHINNLQKNSTDVFVIDWDMYGPGDFRVDVLGFYVHWLGFYFWNDYFDVVKLLKKDHLEFLSIVKEQGFVKSFELLKSFKDWPELIERFLQQRMEWVRKNDPESQFAQQMRVEVQK